MPTPTYTLIEEQVLGSAAASVTFSSIPGTYKDIVLEIVFSFAGGETSILRFNGDTGNNYSRTELLGNGTAASSSRASNVASIYMIGPDANNLTTATANVMSYANTNVNKTVTGRCSTAGNFAEGFVGLWRNTAAITSLTAASFTGANYNSGATFRLWGVAG